MELKKANGRLTPSGWMRELLQRDANGMTGHLDEIFADAGMDVFGTEQVAHKEQGYWSSWWPGEVRGNWLEGLVELAYLLRDSALMRKAESIVENTLKHQDADGYIGIYRKGARYVVTARFGELWTQSRIMRVLLAYYRNTQKEHVLTALIRMADNIVANVPDGVFDIPDEDGSKVHGLMIIDGMFELYRLTNNEAYRAFCVKLYEAYCAHPSQFIEDDLRFVNLFDPSVPFVGHGPHTCETARIPLLLYQMTGDPVYERAFACAGQKLRKNLTLSGSCKSDEFIGTYQSTLVMENDARSSVFGGSVPIPSVGYEYCSTVELMYDYLRAQELTGSFEYADRLEWLVYNAGLASKHPSGKMIQYLGADNMYDASASVNPRFDYSPTHDDAAGCCAANAGRMMPAFVRQAFLNKDGTLIANLYMPVTLRLEAEGGLLTVSERTEYPFENTVTFTVFGAGRTPFALRIPAFAKRCTVRRNGKRAAGRRDGVLFVLSEPLQAGDRIELTFHTEPKLLRAADGTFAVAYGTLLYAKPIEAIRRIRKTYGRRGFYDADYMTKPHTNTDYTILTDEKGRLYCEAPKRERDGYPLDEGCYCLKVRALDRYAYPVALTLAPIGATTLRRTTFPVLRDTDHIYREETL